MPELPALVVPLLLNAKDYAAGLADAQKKATGFKDTFAKVGGGLLLGGLGALAGGITAVSATTIDSISKTTEWGETLDGIGDILGTSSQESAGLALMVQRVGGSADQLTSSMKLMSKGLLDAKGGLGPTGQVLDKLGISVLDANGNMRAATDIFQDVANIVGVMPDGLDKTALMMDIFGKSGGEMGDILAAASNNGLAKFNQEAKNMGLALNDKQTQNVIELGKAQEKLKQTSMGLQVTLGTALVPILTRLAETFTVLLSDPRVMGAITSLTNGLVGLATNVVSFIPTAVDWISKVFNFFANNQEIIVGVLAAIGVAIGYFVYTTVVPALITAWATFSATLLPVIAVIAAIAVGVALLAKAWNSNFLGIRDAVMGFWEKIKPTFDTLVQWLKVNIPAGLQILANFWSNTLLPAINAVWGFLNNYIFPLFKSIADFVGAVLGLAIRVLAGVFQNILLPPIQSLFQWLSNNVFPILKNIGNWLDDKLTPAFNWLGQAIKDVTGFFSDLAQGISILKLPAWLEPHSPPKLYFALLNIKDALNQINGGPLSTFGNQLNIKGVISSSVQNIGNDSAINSLIPYLERGSFDSFDYRRNGKETANAVLMGLASV